MQIARAATRRWRPLQVALLAFIAFAVYGAHRVRFVNGCDSWAYFAQGEVFRGVDPGLYAFADPLRNRALTPHGFDFARGHFVSAYPPGYSLLLALAGFVGGFQYWVNPLLGGFSVALVYLAIAQDTRYVIALAGAALWAACPIVAWCATRVMSDMSATVAVLGSYVLLRRERFALAGLVFGLSLMIRPTNLLFGIAVPMLLPRRRAPFARFAAAFVLGALVTAIVHYVMWQGLLSPKYSAKVGVFLPRYFGSEFPRYALETSYQLGPVLLLALIEAVRAPRRSAPEIGWFGVFVLSYSFAGPVDVTWWYTRYLLPAYPAAFVLAARASEEALWWLGARSRSAFRTSLIAAALALLVWGGFSLSAHRGALVIQAERDEDADAVAARLPADALVGALHLSGSLRLYHGVETFVLVDPAALPFARAEMLRGRPIYLSIEPDMLAEDPPVERFTVAFDLEPVAKFHDFVLFRARAAREQGQLRYTLADPAVSWALLNGWLDSQRPALSSFRSTRCERARLKLLLEPGQAYELDLVAATAEGRDPQPVELSIAGHPLGGATLGVDFSKHTFRIPQELSHSEVALVLHFPAAPRCESGSGSEIARVRSVETRAVGSPSGSLQP